MNIVTDNQKEIKALFQEPVTRIIEESKDSLEMERRLWKFFVDFMCAVLSLLFECIDEKLYETYKKAGYRIQRMDTRSIYCLFGPLTYRRRLLKKEGEPAIYPLDKKLGFVPRKRYSLGMMERIAVIMSRSTSRHTSQAVSLLTQTSVSAQTVVKIKNWAGEKYNDYCRHKAEETGQVHPVPGGIVVVEGDGIVMKGKGEEKRLELHRIQVYEGVEKNGNRTELTGLRSFAGSDRQEVWTQARQYLHSTYNLAELTVLSNGDGGAGYSAKDFEGLGEGCREHIHFRDQYHVNRKIRSRLNFCPRSFIEDFIKALRSTPDVEAMIGPWLGTAGSLARTKEDKKNVERLEAYLKRNAEYIPTLAVRGIKTDIHLGTAETNHRYYTYRMKKQGRSWSKKGFDRMAWLLTGLKNGDLAAGLLYRNKGKACKAIDRDTKKAARAALKEGKEGRGKALRRKAKGFRPACIDGGIAVYGASSSPLGRLAKSLQF